MRRPHLNQTRTTLHARGFSDEINAETFHRRTIFTHPGYAYATATALYLLSGYPQAFARTLTPQQTQTDSYYIHDLTTLTATALAGVIIYRVVLAALRPGFIDPDRTVVARAQRTIGRMSLYVLIIVGTGIIPLTAVEALSSAESGYPPIDQGSVLAVVHGLVHGVAAGFKEELFLVAIPVLVLRAARRPWWEIISLLALVRLSFHIYYGIPVIGYLPWAVAAVLLYRYTHSITPLILGHAAFDTVVHAGEIVPVPLWFWIAVYIGFVLVAIAGVLGLAPRQVQGSQAHPDRQDQRRAKQLQGHDHLQKTPNRGGDDD